MSVRSIHKTAVLCLAVLLAPFLLGSSPSSSGCNGFNGNWKTVWTGGGAVMMKIANGSGTYAWKDGVVGGVVNGSTFIGGYKQNDGQMGILKFVLSDDGNSFTGYYVVDGSSDQVAWSGTCTGP